MMNRILLLCLFFAGSSQTCKWMDTDFKRYTESSLVLLKTMRMNVTNSTDDVVPFPNELYRHAAKAPLSERLSVVVQVLDEIVQLFQENQTRASWSENAAEDFLNVIVQQSEGVRTCNVNYNHHKKLHAKMNLYFKRLSKHVLAEMKFSAEAWEVIREVVRLHIHKAYLLAVSA